VFLKIKLMLGISVWTKISSGTITVSHGSIFCADWDTTEVLVIEENQLGIKRAFLIDAEGDKRKVNYTWIKSHIREVD